MKLSDRLKGLHAEVKSNKWMHYFTTFNRPALAAGCLFPVCQTITSVLLTSKQEKK